MQDQYAICIGKHFARYAEVMGSFNQIHNSAMEPDVAWRAVLIPSVISCLCFSRSTTAESMLEYTLRRASVTNNNPDLMRPSQILCAALSSKNSGV